MGLMLTMMGTLPMIAGLARGDSLLVGWDVHLAIDAILGIGVAAFVALVPLATRLNGLVYGMAVWMAGPRVMMPLWLGKPEMVFTLASADPWRSLMSHMIYGLVAGVVFVRVAYPPVGPRTGDVAPA